MLRLPLLAAAVAVLLAGVGPAAAQDATPAATPGAVACTVAPRSADELIALWFEDVLGTPAVAAPPAPAAAVAEADLPQGEPADAETVAAITATLREVEACFDAGEFARAFALFTDDLVRQFGPGQGVSVEQVRAFLEIPATPVPVEARAEPLAIRDARVLPDGRVGAVLVTAEPTVPGAEDASFLIFERVGDRWLADEIIGIVPAAGTPGAATPAA